eukprot:GHVU01026739.1.p1 GENE.GHVU01026739.1~~GHVU01026739.1.p1  ORF type:complete len:328 (+),score=49.51 GHVU01026739.1:288-1271(+)
MYKDWTADQVRAECTNRNLKVPKSTPTDARRLLLEANDEAKNALREVIDGTTSGVSSAVSTAVASSAAAPGSLAERCRLLNVLFDDSIIEAFMDSGSTPSRAALDARAVGANAPVWQRVADLFNSDQPHLSNLLTPDDMACGSLDLAIHGDRTGPTLCGWWTEMNRRMVKAIRRFRQSGEHDEFAKYCSGQADCVYMHEWLLVKPQAQSFVEGGLLPDTGRDSGRAGGRGCRRGRPSAQSPEEQPEATAALDRMTSVIEAFIEKETVATAAGVTGEQQLQTMLLETSQHIVALLQAKEAEVSHCLPVPAARVEHMSCVCFLRVAPPS